MIFSRFSIDFLPLGNPINIDALRAEIYQKSFENLSKIYADAKGIIKNSCFSCFSMFPDYLMFFLNI